MIPADAEAQRAGRRRKRRARRKAKGAELKGINPWLIAIIVSVATFMEVLDTTIANVALRYISGGLAVGPDEAAWVVTTYLVANSIVLCASGWIAEALGRKRFFMICLALFTLSSALCGFAWNLDSLLFFRVLQGLAGGGMTPVAQSILAAAFPPEKRGQGFAHLRRRRRGGACRRADARRLAQRQLLLALVLPDQRAGRASCRWSLVCAAASPIRQGSRRSAQSIWAKADSASTIIGFLLIATFLGALEVVLDRGQEDDWFGSNFIITFAVVSARCRCVLFVPWELIRKDPLIDLRMLAGRQFGTCFLIMLVTGGILIATTQFLPQILQEYFGYTATLAGLAISPGGLVTMVMMFVVGRLSGRRAAEISDRRRRPRSWPPRCTT